MIAYMYAHTEITLYILQYDGIKYNISERRIALPILGDGDHSMPLRMTSISFIVRACVRACTSI